MERHKRAGTRRHTRSVPRYFQYWPVGSPSGPMAGPAGGTDRELLKGASQHYILKLREAARTSSIKACQQARGLASAPRKQPSPGLQVLTGKTAPCGLASTDPTIRFWCIASSPQAAAESPCRASTPPGLPPCPKGAGAAAAHRGGSVCPGHCHGRQLSGAGSPSGASGARVSGAAGECENASVAASRSAAEAVNGCPTGHGRHRHHRHHPHAVSPAPSR